MRKFFGFTTSAALVVSLAYTGYALVMMTPGVLYSLGRDYHLAAWLTVALVAYECLIRGEHYRVTWLCRAIGVISIAGVLPVIAAILMVPFVLWKEGYLAAMAIVPVIATVLLGNYRVWRELAS